MPRQRSQSSASCSGLYGRTHTYEAYKQHCLCVTGDKAHPLQQDVCEVDAQAGVVSGQGGRAGGDDGRLGVVPLEGLEEAAHQQGLVCLPWELAHLAGHLSCVGRLPQSAAPPLCADLSACNGWPAQGACGLLGCRQGHGHVHVMLCDPALPRPLVHMAQCA